MLRDKRFFLGFFLFYNTILCFPAYSFSNIEGKYIQKTIDHFLSIKTIQGKFIQKDVKGNTITGEFFMVRPGKFYFKYSSPSEMTIISDGSNLALYDKKLDTWSVYPLHYTGFGVIFSDKRDAFRKCIQNLEIKDKIITIFCGDNSARNMVALSFDKLSYRLINWEIIDDMGSSSFVEILKYKKNIAISPELFIIPYDKIHGIR